MNSKQGKEKKRVDNRYCSMVTLWARFDKLPLVTVDLYILALYLCRKFSAGKKTTMQTIIRQEAQAPDPPPRIHTSTHVVGRAGFNQTGDFKGSQVGPNSLRGPTTSICVKKRGHDKSGQGRSVGSQGLGGKKLQRWGERYHRNAIGPRVRMMRDVCAPPPPPPRRTPPAAGPTAP